MRVPRKRSRGSASVNHATHNSAHVPSRCSKPGEAVASVSHSTWSELFYFFVVDFVGMLPFLFPFFSCVFHLLGVIDRLGQCFGTAVRHVQEEDEDSCTEDSERCPHQRGASCPECRPHQNAH